MLVLVAKLGGSRHGLYLPLPAHVLFKSVPAARWIAKIQILNALAHKTLKVSGLLTRGVII